MIRRLFLAATENVASAAAIVGIFSLLSRFIGLVRDYILVGSIGLGDTLDAYYAAFRVPDTFFQLLIVGTLSASFIPIFSHYFSKDHERAWRYVSHMLNGLLVLFTLCSFLFVLFADDIVPLIAWGFNPDKQLLTASMMRVLFLGQCFFALSMVFGSVLQASRRFFLYSLAPILYNVGIIFGAVMLVPIFGPLGLAWGTVFGAFLHALVQGVGVFALGYRYRPSFSLDHDVRKTLLQMGPRTLSLAMTQINFLIMTSIASTFTAGSVAMLQYAYNLNFFPIGVVAVSYAIAAFPAFCAAVQENKKVSRAFVDTFSSTVRQVLFFMVPATVLFLLLRAQIVRLVLGAQGFSWEATIMTADVLALFAISFCAQSLVYILVRGFFACEKTAIPVVIALISTGINIVLSFVLAPIWGLLGLAIAFSIAAVVQCAALWGWLRLLVGSLDGRNILRSLAIISFAGMIMAIVTQIAKYEVVKYIPLTTYVGVLLQFVIATSIGGFVYLGIAALLRSPELVSIFAGLKRKMLKRAAPKEIPQNQIGS